MEFAGEPSPHMIVEGFARGLYWVESRLLWSEGIGYSRSLGFHSTAHMLAGTQAESSSQSIHVLFHYGYQVGICFSKRERQLTNSKVLSRNLASLNLHRRTFYIIVFLSMLFGTGFVGEDEVAIMSWITHQSEGLLFSSFVGA